MKKQILALSILSTATLLSASIATAKPLALGIGGGWTDSPYKGYGGIYYPLPYVEFDNDILFIKGLTAGAYLYNDNDQKLSIGVSYLPLEFKPKDTDNSRLKQLKKRHSTMLAEIKYAISTEWGRFAASIGGDVLNESNSILASANYSYPFYGEKWVVAPEIGIHWANNKHNDYYFGVSHKEAARSGLAYHNAKSSFTPYIALTGSYALTDHISTYAGVRLDKSTGDAKDSPMVANSTTPSVFLGVNYTF